MNKNLIKKLFIFWGILLIALQCIHLFVLPSVINNYLSSAKFSSDVKEYFNLDLGCDEFYVKSYPDFSLQLKAKSISLKDKKQTVLLAKNIDTSVFLPSLLFKKLVLKNLDISSFETIVTLQKDNKFYFGGIF